MKDFQERYKRLGFGREDVDVNRVLRSQRRDEVRREQRTEQFSQRRDLDVSTAELSEDRESLEFGASVKQQQRQQQESSPHRETRNKANASAASTTATTSSADLEVAVQQRLLELEKWQKERARRKVAEKRKAKPAFKVGVVHHRVYSPPLTKDPVPPPPAKLCKSKEIKIEQPPKRVTRATEKRLAAKAVTNQQKRENIRNQKKVQVNIKRQSHKSPLVPKDYQFKAPVGVSSLPMFGRLELENQEMSSERKSIVDLNHKHLLDITLSDLSTLKSPRRRSSRHLKNIPTTNIQDQSLISFSPRHSMKLKTEKSKNLVSSSEVTSTTPLSNIKDQSIVEFYSVDVKSDEKLNESETFELLKNNETFEKLNKSAFLETVKEKSPEKLKKSVCSETVKEKSSENLNRSACLETAKGKSTKNLNRSAYLETAKGKSSENLNRSACLETAKGKSSEKLNKSSLKSVKEKSLEKLNRSSFLESMKENNTEKSNDSGSFELIKQKSPDKQENDSQNFSLNLNETASSDSLLEKPPAFFSPYIVTSRGKSNIRKEVQRRRFSQRIEDIPTKDTVMQNLNISAEEEERTAQYYKYILDKEIERLNNRCDSWNVIKDAEETPENVRYTIQAAVGHTQLLINKKFQRFRGLVLDCETGKGEMLVTCKDLQGFWDMMYMEVVDCDNRFNKLEELKAKNWTEEEAEVNKEAQPKKKVVKKAATKKKPAPTKSSSIRAHILAARKKMQNKEDEMDIDMKESTVNSRPQENNIMQTPKTESTKNMRRTLTTPRSLNRRQSLLNKVQTSDKRMSSPLIVMKLSQMCKTPEIQLDDSIVYINSDRTPAKSILKTSKDDMISSIVKSTNKVFFKEQPMEVQEFEVDKENQRNSDNFHNIEFKEPVERKLDFENDNLSITDIENEKKIAEKHELYLNHEGIICDKLIPQNKATPKSKKLRRSHSERSTRSTKNKDVESVKMNETIDTPRLRRRTSHVPQKTESEMKELVLSVDKLTMDNNSLLTPKTRKRSLKRSFAEAQLTDGIENKSTVKGTPKISKKEEKFEVTENNASLNRSIEKPQISRLRRTKSLSTADKNKDQNESVVKSTRSTLRRTNSKSINLRRENSKDL